MTSLNGENWKDQIRDVLSVRVTPNASANRIKGEVIPDGSVRLRVYVTTTAEGGKANQKVIQLIAKELGLPPSALTITHGLLARDKIIKVKV